jgi:5'-3' exonuclease
MGIKNFVNQEIIAKFPNTHTSIVPSNVQYFYIDANSIVYDVYYKIKDQPDIPTDQDHLEKWIVQQTILVIQSMITEYVKPVRLCYIALDGTVPKAKMIRSRWRRYKSVIESEYINGIKQSLGIPIPTNKWDASANISPGTPFMSLLSKELHKSIEKGHMNLHQQDCTIVFSDASIPGEGEHKYLPHMKQLRHDTTSQVVVYSPDADMVVLSMLTHKNKIHVMKPVHHLSKEIRPLYGEKLYVYISIDQVKESFLKSQQLSSFTKGNTLYMEHIINDYIALLSLCGDDFVLPIPYLEVKERGSDLLIRLYRTLLPQFQGQFLLLWNPTPSSTSIRPQINIPFLMAILIEISKMEDYKMKKIQDDLKHSLKKRQHEADQHIPSKDPYEELSYFENMIHHSLVGVSQHPMYQEYGSDWKLVDCNQPKMSWKAQYYTSLFGLDPNNIAEYNKMRQHIATEYLKSFMFTNIYYFDGIPSWTWYYPYYAPPCASDLVFALKHFHNINMIPFDQGVPYKPFEQLMFVTAPQNALSILPKKIATGMIHPKSPILSYFPMKYRANVVFSNKWDRVDVLFLPDLPDSEMLSWLSEVFPKLSKKDSLRNINTDLPLIYRGKKGLGVPYIHIPISMSTIMPSFPLTISMDLLTNKTKKVTIV